MEYIGKPFIPAAKPKKPVPLSFAEALNEKDPVTAIWPALVDCVSRNSSEHLLENLSAEAQNIYLCCLLVVELDNGGFDQYFYNRSGRYTMETTRSLNILNCEILESLLQRALLLFPHGLVPKEDQQRRELLAEVSEESLLALDREYNQSINSIDEEVNIPENPWYLALSYMRKHTNARVSA